MQVQTQAQEKSDLNSCISDRAFLRALDHIHSIFGRGSVHQAMSRLVEVLDLAKRTLSPTQWLHFASDWARHPVAALVHQDPLTFWAFRQPRGYPGDAWLLDFIYRSDNIREAVAGATDCGRTIYDFTASSDAAVAVRDRRDRIAALVDGVARRRGQPIDVLAIACGHLRESEIAEAPRLGLINRWVALDQDEASVSYVRNLTGLSSVVPLRGSVRGLLAGHYDLGTFDVVYAAGLYDYLGEKAAQRLTETAFAMLKPGGTLLYANFAVGIRDAAYLEVCMNWHLIYRDIAKMEAIAAGLPQDQVLNRQFFYGGNRNLAYAAIKKADN